MTLPFLSTIRADNPISAAGPESVAIRKRLTSIRSWKSACPISGDTQRRVGDIVILKTLDQPGLQQFRNAVGPDHIRKARIVLGGREQEPLRLEHRDRGRLRDRQLSLDGLARRSEILRSAQIVGNLLRRRAAACHLFEAGDDAVEFAGVARQPVRRRPADWRWCSSAAPNFRSAPNRPCATHRGRPGSCSGPRRVRQSASAPDRNSPAACRLPARSRERRSGPGIPGRPWCRPAPASSRRPRSSH